MIMVIIMMFLQRPAPLCEQEVVLHEEQVCREVRSQARGTFAFFMMICTMVLLLLMAAMLRMNAKQKVCFLQDHEIWITRLDDNHGCGHENN